MVTLGDAAQVNDQTQPQRKGRMERKTGGPHSFPPYSITVIPDKKDTKHRA